VTFAGRLDRHLLVDLPSPLDRESIIVRPAYWCMSLCACAVVTAYRTAPHRAGLCVLSLAAAAVRALRLVTRGASVGGDRSLHGSIFARRSRVSVSQSRHRGVCSTRQRGATTRFPLCVCVLRVARVRVCTCVLDAHVTLVRCFCDVPQTTDGAGARATVTEADVRVAMQSVEASTTAEEVALLSAWAAS
jgi:hypothetical protein